MSAARLPLLLLAGALVWAGAPRTAAAYSYWECSGEPMVWNVHMSTQQNLFSIPSGSTAEGAFFNAVNRWNGVRGMNDVIALGGVTFGNVITHGDGESDVALVNRSNIQGNSGLTYVSYGGCWAWGADIDEADVMVANDMPNANPSETGITATGRDVFVHEFGHALGLDHAQHNNMMRAAQPLPRVGGTGEHIHVLADDARGGRFLYPSGNSETNLYASAQRVENGAITNDQGATPQFACPGGSIFLSFTVGNNGTVPITNNWRYSMHTSLTGYTGGNTMGNWNNATNNANSVFSGAVIVTVPNVAPGLYRIFYRVDRNNTAAESREADNVVRLNKTLQVLDCN